jgi:hypothetical protein
MMTLDEHSAFRHRPFPVEIEEVLISFFPDESS